MCFDYSFVWNTMTYFDVDAPGQLFFAQVHVYPPYAESVY